MPSPTVVAMNRLWSRATAIAATALLASAIVTAPATAVEDETAAGFETVLRDTNDYREAHGLERLVHDPALSAVAQAWAEQMAADYNATRDISTAFRHNPNMPSQVPSGWQSVGENIAWNMGYPSPYEHLMAQWKASPAHNTNMLTERWTSIGIGTYQDSFGGTWGVQVFGDYGTPSAIPDPGAAVIDLDDISYSGTAACVVLVREPAGSDFFTQCGSRLGNAFVFSDVPPGSYSARVLDAGGGTLYSGWPGGSFTVASDNLNGLPQVGVSVSTYPVACVDGRLQKGGVTWTYGDFGGDTASEIAQSQAGISSVVVTQNGSTITGADDAVEGPVNVTVTMKTGFRMAPAYLAGKTVDIKGNIVTFRENVAASGTPCGPRIFPDGITRLYGGSRYDTAAAVSAEFPSGVPAVFIASGENFPDALSAAAAAAHLNGPLLLTSPSTLPSSVLAEVKRLKPGHIYIAGGTGAVSTSVANALAAVAPVTRFGGADRYSTGLQISKGTFTSSSSVILASGRAFPDALAATGVAGKLDAPVILVDGNQSSVPAAVLTELQRLGTNDVIIAGGAGAISSGIESQLRRSGFTVSRFGGTDRYQTAALLNTAFFTPSETDTYVLANGVNFPDGLAGSALAGRIDAPLYTTMPNCMPKSVKTSITNLGTTKSVVLGGTAVLSNAAAQKTACP